MVIEENIETLRKSALDHSFMLGDWVQMAEEGGPQFIVEGKGIRVTDSDGKQWIDANSGYASVNVGYGRTEIADAVREQMLKLSYYPINTATEILSKLAEKLAQITPGSLERIWPVTGGSEANETATKIVRSYHRRKGEPGRYKVISRRRDYHGAIGQTLWMGAMRNLSDYEPGYPGMLYAPQPDPYRCPMGGKTRSECAIRCAQAVEDLILFNGPNTVAALIGAPISAEGASVVPGDEYWPMVREICDKYGVLIIADEVVTGFGRTGKMFGIEHSGFIPDLMSVAKGLTSTYLPMGSVIATREVAEVFAGEENLFPQALTFGGHPVTAAAALKNIEIIERDKLVENSAKTGEYFLGQLKELKKEHKIIGEARGMGLLLGLELVSDQQTKERNWNDAEVGKKLVDRFRAHGLLLKTAGATISIGPALSITRSEVDEIVLALDRSFGEVEDEILASVDSRLTKPLLHT